MLFNNTANNRCGTTLLKPFFINREQLVRLWPCTLSRLKCSRPVILVRELCPWECMREECHMCNHSYPQNIAPTLFNWFRVTWKIKVLTSLQNHGKDVIVFSRDENHDDVRFSSCLCWWITAVKISEIEGSVFNVSGSNFDHRNFDHWSFDLRDSLISETLITEALISETLISETFISETFISETLIAETLISETLISKTLISETLISETLITEALISETLISETLHRSCWSQKLSSLKLWSQKLWSRKLWSQKLWSEKLWSPKLWSQRPWILDLRNFHHRNFHHKKLWSRKLWPPKNWKYHAGLFRAFFPLDISSIGRAGWVLIETKWIPLSRADCLIPVLGNAGECGP